MEREMIYQGCHLQAYKQDGRYYVVDLLSQRIMGQAEYDMKTAFERAYSFIRQFDMQSNDNYGLSRRQVFLQDIIDGANKLEYGNLRTSQMVNNLAKWKNVMTDGMSYHHRIEISREYPEDMSFDIFLIKTNKTIEVDGIPVMKEITLQMPVRKLEEKWKEMSDILAKFVNDPTSI